MAHVRATSQLRFQGLFFDPPVVPFTWGYGVLNLGSKKRGLGSGFT